MTKLQVLTNSETGAFDDCRALHGYCYHDLLRPLVSTAPQSRGTMYHAGLKAGWLAAWACKSGEESAVPERAQVADDAAFTAVWDQFKATLAAEPEASLERQGELEEARDVALFGVHHYWQQNRERLDEGRCVPLLIEAPFSVRLRNAKGNLTNVQFEGVIDRVTFDVEQNAIVVEDDKCPEQPSRIASKLDLDTQLTAYVYAISELRKLPTDAIWGWSIARFGAKRVNEILATASLGNVAFSVMKGKVPTKPGLNQDGSVSVRQIDTLPTYYSEALMDQESRGKPISDKQRALLEKLQGNIWYERHEFMRGGPEIQRWLAETLVKAEEIRRTKRHPELRVRNARHCTGIASSVCAYKAVCMDPTSEAIRSRCYRLATSRHEEVAGARESHGSEENADPIY